MLLNHFRREMIRCLVVGQREREREKTHKDKRANKKTSIYNNDVCFGAEKKRGEREKSYYYNNAL